jgi:hypothetical protein
LRTLLLLLSFESRERCTKLGGKLFFPKCERKIPHGSFIAVMKEKHTQARCFLVPCLVFVVAVVVVVVVAVVAVYSASAVAAAAQPAA